MKATLTIEVPDDFKKGECLRCGITYDGVSCAWLSDNCPLEIQDENYCPMKMECENCKGV